VIKSLFAKSSISIAATAAALSSAPVLAGTTADTFRQATSPDLLAEIGGQPSTKEKEGLAAIFSAIDGKKWDEAARLVDAAPKGPLASIARAELYLAAGSPKVDGSQLQKLLNDAPWLPQAEQLEKMATKRGALDLPVRPGTKRFSYLGSAPKRDLPDSNPSAATLRERMQVEIKTDNPAGAEAILEAQAASLDQAALTELRYRVAWSY
jgi:soluble lytic murein transglycosylase